jgi:DNA polymerase elongation subunit (family B)
MDNVIGVDLETFKNYFLINFKKVSTGKSIKYELLGQDSFFSSDQIKNIKGLLGKYMIFGFNSQSFDIPILLQSLKQKPTIDLFNMGQDIIQNNLRDWQSYKKYSIQKPPFLKHFDIMDVLPGVGISLKLYASRIGFKTIQDLPYDPEEELISDQVNVIKKYCDNDIDITIALYNILKPALELRKTLGQEYNLDLMSKSDPQIAELVIKSELFKILGINYISKPILTPGYSFNYIPPDYIKFETENLNGLLKIVSELNFTLTAHGSVKIPTELSKYKIFVGDKKYKIGIGGLHSQEKKQTCIATSNELLVEKDVVSYYPKIILNQKIYPRHLGIPFLQVYNKIVDKRIAAKRDGLKMVNECLKIVINGTFGKLGSKYSFLYSPAKFIQVTITGQLSLLMLIEKLHLAGIETISANTDGIVCLFNKNNYENYQSICKNWESVTNFDLEETFYKAIYSRDVNNYVAVKNDGSLKYKGVFAKDSLNKNQINKICIVAVVKYLTENIPIEKTIKGCKDLDMFCQSRRVTGGAMHNNKYLGKVVRFYYSSCGSNIYYKVANKTGNFNKVAMSNNTMPAMVLADNLPSDIDYKRYESEAYKILENIGYLNI